MDALVAIVSAGFAASPWTNQEIGVALGRGVPVISVRIDEDPRGFIGAAQAIPGTGKGARIVATAIASATEIYPQVAAALRESPAFLARVKTPST